MKLIDIYRNARRAYLRMKKRAKMGPFPITRPYDRFHKEVFQSYNVPHWFDALFPRLASALMKATGAKDYRIIGPAGISSTCFVDLFFTDKTEPGPDDKHVSRPCKTLAFRPQTPFGKPGEMGLSVINYLVDTGEFKSDSIGAMNGLNHPSTKLDPNMTMEELFSLFHDGNHVERAS